MPAVLLWLACLCRRQLDLPELRVGVHVEFLSGLRYEKAHGLDLPELRCRMHK